jgi:hypothetical protein
MSIDRGPHPGHHSTTCHGGIPYHPNPPADQVIPSLPSKKMKSVHFFGGIWVGF